VRKRVAHAIVAAAEGAHVRGCRQLILSLSFALGVAAVPSSLAAQLETAEEPGPVEPGSGVSDQPEPVPEQLATASPSGLGAEQAARRAVANSFTVGAAVERLSAAQATVQQAWGAFLPTITGAARATYLSDVDRSDGPSVVSVVVAADPNTPNGTPGPFPTMAYQVDLSYRPLREQYVLQGTVTVPLSDYFLRINRQYQAARHGEDAARGELAAAQARSFTEGRIAYYTWLRARESLVLAVEALNDGRQQLRDVRNFRAAGMASGVDVQQAATTVIGLQVQVENARAQVAVSEDVLRTALALPPGAPLQPSEDLDAPLAGLPIDAAPLASEALATRPELQALSASAGALREQAGAQRGAMLPSLSLVANAYYANPAPRQVQQRDDWDTAWDVGAVLTWTPTDMVSTLGAAAATEARARALVAEREQLARETALEVRRTLAAARAHDAALELAERQVQSAAAEVRIARELFMSNQATAFTVLDARGSYIRARLARLNAQAEARIGRAMLDHAVGRSAKAARASAAEMRARQPPP
jgi:outer membrane protein TolC